MTVQRRPLPMRRNCETIEIPFGGFDRVHTVTLGFYEDDSVGEVFINGGKSGEQVEAIARDGAVLLSMALQYGVPLTTIQGAVTRDARGAPQSIVGAVVDQLVGTL